MNEERQIVVLVSQLAVIEMEFFAGWGVRPPVEPYVAYFCAGGSTCAAAEARVLLVRGDAPDLPTRIVGAVSKSCAGMENAYLAVHMGGGGKLVPALDGKFAPSDIAPHWEKLKSRSFSWSSSGSAEEAAFRKFLGELGVYAKRKYESEFKSALQLLFEALNLALDSHPGGLVQAVARSKAAWPILDSQERRRRVGLSAIEPARPARNPVAALIHNVVSCFDALLIDLETAAEEPDYWRDEKVRYKGEIEGDLNRLRKLARADDAGILNPESLTEIGRTIKESGGANGEDRTLLEVTFERLRALVPVDDVLPSFRLLMEINEGRKDKVARSDIEHLRKWLYDLRSELAILDQLYRKCVLTVWTDCLERSS